jgi:hypothetical protein
MMPERGPLDPDVVRALRAYWELADASPSCIPQTRMIPPWCTRGDSNPQALRRRNLNYSPCAGSENPAIATIRRGIASA